MSVQPDYAFTPPPVNLTDIARQSGAPADETDHDLHQELATLRAQTECLLQELQLCQQTANEQQRLIENLAEQLRQSQQRIQQLEQIQTLQQRRLQEQEAALTQEQQQRQELEARLYRQQQENLRLRQLLYTYAPNTDWEKQARLYQDPIPPGRRNPNRLNPQRPSPVKRPWLTCRRLRGVNSPASRRPTTGRGTPTATGIPIPISVTGIGQHRDDFDAGALIATELAGFMNFFGACGTAQNRLRCSQGLVPAAGATGIVRKPRFLTHDHDVGTISAFHQHISNRAEFLFPALSTGETVCDGLWAG